MRGHASVRLELDNSFCSQPQHGSTASQPKPEESEMSDNLVFRLATPSDDARILELFRLSFGRELPLEWWKWFNYRCPCGANRTSIIEDLDTGQVVGSYSLLPIKLLLNDSEVSASLCTNVNTHPDYQRRGLFTRISNYALGREKDFGTPVSLGMPNQKAYPGHMKVGWEVLCPLPFLVKHDCRQRSHACREVDSFDERLDQFLSRISSRFSFLVLKDHHFMNWRVVTRPDKEYTKYVCEEGSDLKGYVVLKHFDDQGYRKSHILDIQAETDDILCELLAAAESFAHGRDELNMWTNPHNPYAHSILAQGFYERESQDQLIIHFNFGERTPLREQAWWFCLADNDVY